MAMPKATVMITKPCRTTSAARRFQRASPKDTPDVPENGVEIVTKIGGNDNSAPATTTVNRFLV